MSETTQAPTVRIGTWNTDRAGTGSNKNKDGRVRAELAGPACHILCVTEGSAALMPDEGCAIDAGTNWTDWGIRPPPEHLRKVVLWSRCPWTDVDCVGLPEFPGGRFVKGVTGTPVGPLTVVGVCIPWKGARGRGDWQDHEAWLEAFELLPWRCRTDRMVVLGDFNQTIRRDMRRVRAPRKEKLRRAFAGLEITTAGDVPDAPGLLDHIAHSKDLQRSGSIGVWPKRQRRGEPLPDHFGVRADFGLAPTT